LQADAEMDAGPVWASVNFPMRVARKSSLYRNEVTETAVTAVLQAVDRFETGKFIPEQLNESRSDERGKWRPLVKQSDRRIDWPTDDTQTVLRKIHSADGFPGIEDTLLGVACRLYDACAENTLRGAPGKIIARRHGAICRATCDGAVWIGHIKKIVSGEKTFKLPATLALHDRLGVIPEVTLAPDVPPAHLTYKDIWYEEKAGVGYLHFDFYNGAMSTEQCQRLREAYLQACQRPTRVIVLMGGPDFWSNGIHLNCIEAADSPADESWRNINAMDDLAQAIIKTDSHLTIAALQGNTAAGGVFLALAADRLYAREGVVLNPHYKNMGNLYGSEYWSYLLPKRMGEQGRKIMEHRLPLVAPAAKRIGLIDDCFGGSVHEFVMMIRSVAEALAADPDFGIQLEAKRRQRAKDESVKPLEAYRTEELERMKLNFYGFDPSYHVARYNFVFRVPHSWTPLHLARHRQRIKNTKPTDAVASSRSISAARRPTLSAG
ncbi:MAG: enoyl-CoA hydratase-related protein, partial [Sulfuricaulis sp.]|uniref:enoyl-CoA hydratase-related protein n=1 Tax=Sulfuricaulis sp. TaxID=2003553 RepID=UPI003C3698F9